MASPAPELAPPTMDEMAPVSHHDVIETVISGMAQENTALVQHNDQGTIWKFSYGSVEVLVQLTGEGENDLFRVWADVMTLPGDNAAPLLTEVMQLNWSDTFEACFALRENHLVALHQRTVAELSPGEISRAITLVATLADDHDDRLKEKYGV
ncbi:YbjN domain-containing protein [Synechocystis salina]|uniref:YbjN domain-containing protein n=1 Tax=Synechocystis salina TaxID=945780 RepID=UPI001D13FBA0|nr:YbjN domain-containing protein [Synechocystis salina]